MPKPSRPLEAETATEERSRDSSPSVQVVPKRGRRRFDVATKMRLLKAAEAAVASGERGALEALLRREGIYNSHLSSWRHALIARGTDGLAARKPGRVPKLDAKDKQLLTMAKQKAALERQLRIAHALIELQKKAHALLGLTLPEWDEKSL